MALLWLGNILGIPGQTHFCEGQAPGSLFMTKALRTTPAEHVEVGVHAFA